MDTDTVATPPSVSWAQRSTRVFLTINVECEKPDVKIEKKVISFKGISTPDQKLYEVDIPLYAEIDPDTSNYVNKGRLVEVVLVKEKQDETFWPTLTSDKKKHHWLRVDFNRWQDEDESGEEGDNMVDMFSDKIGDFGDDFENDDSSCNEDLPDIE